MDIRLKVKHVELVRKGEYGAAWYVLRLLRNRIVRLNLDDDAWTAQRALEEAGLKPSSYRCNYTIAIFKLRRA